jgi:hypothetical protein
MKKMTLILLLLSLSCKEIQQRQQTEGADALAQSRSMVEDIMWHAVKAKPYTKKQGTEHIDRIIEETKDVDKFIKKGQVAVVSAQNETGYWKQQFTIASLRIKQLESQFLSETQKFYVRIAVILWIIAGILLRFLSVTGKFPWLEEKLTHMIPFAGIWKMFL